MTAHLPIHLLVAGKGESGVRKEGGREKQKPEEGADEDPKPRGRLCFLLGSGLRDKAGLGRSLLWVWFLSVRKGWEAPGVQCACVLYGLGSCPFAESGSFPA